MMQSLEIVLKWNDGMSGDWNLIKFFQIGP